MTIKKPCSAEQAQVLIRNASRVVNVAGQWILIESAAGWTEAPLPGQDWKAEFEYLADHPADVLNADEECRQIVASLFPELTILPG